MGDPIKAFPLRARSNGSILERSHEGMDLRDWFAGQALDGDFLKTLSPEAAAAAAYEYADAMLAHRAKAQP